MTSIAHESVDELTLPIERGLQKLSELTAELDHTGPGGVGLGTEVASRCLAARAEAIERCRPTTCPDVTGPVGSAPVADPEHPAHRWGTGLSGRRVENCLAGHRHGFLR